MIQIGGRLVNHVNDTPSLHHLEVPDVIEGRVTSSIVGENPGRLQLVLNSVNWDVGGALDDGKEVDL